MDEDFWADSLKEELIMQGYSPTDARLALLRSDAFDTPNAAAVDIANGRHVR